VINISLLIGDETKREAANRSSQKRKGIK